MIIEAGRIWVRLGGVEVLRGVEIRVSQGESVALIGRNGAGKTTLLRTLMGIVRPYRGSVKVKLGNKEFDVTRLKPHKVARLGVGYVPQGRMVFPDLTVEENLEVVYGGKVPSDTLEWIYTVFPELRKLRGRLAGYLSGGEQQMLAVARALVRKPKILLLDEPFEGLAPRAVARLAEALRDIRAEGVGLLVTEPGSVKRVQGVAEAAYGIDRGEIVYRGPLEGILSDPVARKRIWGFE
ncbi:ABC transporter ATP-binding protein [Pyrofollis japonicus]|uniref:ABC transporter ATP-binding protein n=1 Tax=Pyrofollis japonicus TaxID=3060460 RepID=UPI00295BC934|nr:ABC transporter ATP-binding protein [Pyrofollis japonicus]BEP17299.1 ABC transporter ATP-binding protein [Pyrofollis japonicus]